MFNRIEFVIGEALSALNRNRLMTLAAVTTVAVALFIFGGMGYAYYRVNQVAETIPGKFRMLVYLKDDATKSDVQRVIRDFRAIPGVSSVSWIPKDLAWQRWKTEHQSALTEGVENPLPEGFRVVLSDLKQSDSVVASIKSNPLVATENGVRYMREEQNFVSGMLVGLRIGGLVIGGILLLIAGVLIYNAIRLTVLSRRLEIRVMQLVGASRPTVYIPFVIEGMLQGVVGAIVATALVIGSYSGYNWVVQNNIQPTYAPSPFPYLPVLGLLSAAGATYGILCSVLAVRAPLKYR